MSKKIESSQSPIIDELYKIREERWDKFRGDMRKLSKDAEKHAKKRGFKFSEPKYRNIKTLEDMKELKKKQKKEDPAA